MVSFKYCQIDKFPVRLFKKKKKRHELLISPIKREYHLLTDFTPSKRIRKYYKQLYIKKFNNLNEMNKILKKTNCTSSLKKKYPEWPYINERNWICILKLSHKENSRSRWFHRQILPNIQKKVNIISIQILPENKRETNTSQLILWGQYCTDTKNKQRYYEKKSTNQYFS